MRRVLIVDDDRLFADALDEDLVSWGYAVETVFDPSALRVRLEGEAPHVVLLDVRLAGPSGVGVDGVALAPEILAVWPRTRVIVVTGYADNEVIRRAFAAGAADILRKDEVLGEMLKHKVSRAADDAERDFAVDPARRDRDLLSAWQEAQQQTDKNLKGAALERVMGLLLGSIPGLTGRQRVRSSSEEFDVLVANCSQHPLLQRQGDVWLVECKNWSTPVGVDAARGLVQKMRHRFGRCRLGLLVSMQGFARTVADELRRESSTELLVIDVDGDALGEWIAADDREGWLVDRVVAAAGG